MQSACTSSSSSLSSPSQSSSPTSWAMAALIASQPISEAAVFAICAQVVRETNLVCEVGRLLIEVSVSIAAFLVYRSPTSTVRRSWSSVDI